MHGSVYWREGVSARLVALDSSRPLAEQLIVWLYGLVWIATTARCIATLLKVELNSAQDCFSVADSPVWQDGSTTDLSAELEATIGGAQVYFLYSWIMIFNKGYCMLYNIKLQIQILYFVCTHIVWARISFLQYYRALKFNTVIWLSFLWHTNFSTAFGWVDRSTRLRAFYRPTDCEDRAHAPWPLQTDRGFDIKIICIYVWVFWAYLSLAICFIASI